MLNEREKELFEELFKKGKKPPTKTNGFKSLVTDEEFGAILLLKKALDNYLNTHDEAIKKELERDSMVDMSDYALIQYLLLGECAKEVVKNIDLMVGIHTLDKEVIDGLAKKEELSVSDFLQKLTVDAILHSLLG